MSFFLSGSLSQKKIYEFRPNLYSSWFSVGNYIQNLRDLCYNSDGFFDASRVYDRFKIEGGCITLTLTAILRDPSDISFTDSGLLSICGAVRYGKNLSVKITPQSVYERSNWLFPSHVVSVDSSGRYLPYTESIHIPIKTGFTTFNKCFGNLYNILFCLAMRVGNGQPAPISHFHKDFDLMLTMDWKFDCVGEGSGGMTLDWVPCMLFAFDQRQGDRALSLI